MSFPATRRNGSRKKLKNLMLFEFSGKKFFFDNAHRQLHYTNKIYRLRILANRNELFSASEDSKRSEN